MPITVRERPPLELHAEVDLPDGTVAKWHSGAADPGDRLRSIGFGTARYDGFKAGGCSLPRRIDQPQLDLELFNRFRLVGGDGSIAYEGRITGLPRSTGAPPQWTVQAAGLMANARDRKFHMPFIDRDMSRWQPPSMARRTAMATGGIPQGKFNTTVNSGGITWDVPNEALPLSESAELYYDAGQGVGIEKVFYNGARSGASWAGSFEAATLFIDSADTVPSAQTASLTLDGNPQSATGWTPERYAMLRARVSAAVTPAVGHQQQFSGLGVVGDHGITLRGGSTTGVYASDVIEWLIETYCPQLNASGVQQTSYPIGHLVFRERTFPYDALLTVNSYHRWGLECWENGAVHYAPLDLTDYDWELRLDDFGTSLDVAGASADEVANAIEVTFTDVADGTTKTLLPDEYTDLRDTNPLNPANRAGLYKAIDYQLSSLSTIYDALQIGQAALAEFNAPKHKGTATREGYIKDRAGNWQPVWKVRAGDRVLITDSVDEEVHVVFETDYSHEPRPSVRIAVDDTFQRLDAYLDRYATALQTRGL